MEHNAHPDYQNKKVAIIGGGNVAIDCARTIKRLGAQEVKVIYRRAEEQMPAEVKEIQEAKEEEIEFLFQNNIVKILGKDKVEQVELIKTELVQKEGETRKVPVNAEEEIQKIIDSVYGEKKPTTPEELADNVFGKKIEELPKLDLSSVYGKLGNKYRLLESSIPDDITEDDLPPIEDVMNGVSELARQIGEQPRDMQFKIPKDWDTKK